jgi:hypothetical protein
LNVLFVIFLFDKAVPELRSRLVKDSDADIAVGQLGIQTPFEPVLRPGGLFAVVREDL